MKREPSEIRRGIIRQLKETRIAQGLSLRDMERLAGVDNSNLSAMEKGERSITLDTLIKLTRALGLKIVLVPSNED